jgi:type II secretory pathway pseudopilin PulG
MSGEEMLRSLAPIVAASLVAGLALPGLAQPGSRAVYEQQQQAYQQALAEYQQAMLRYQKEKAEYDGVNGRGAYDRRFGSPIAPIPPLPPPPPQTPAPSPPVSSNIRTKGAPPQGRGFAPDPGPPYMGPACARRPEMDAAALTTAMINAAGGRPAFSSKAEGAVLGALIDGTLGANLAAGRGSAERYAPDCDAEGFFFSVDQTFPYRESATGRRVRNGRYDETVYIEQGCRLAVGGALIRGRVEYRYVRVCPDRRGRMRFTD